MRHIKFDTKVFLETMTNNCCYNKRQKYAKSFFLKGMCLGSFVLNVPSQTKCTQNMSKTFGC